MKALYWVSALATIGACGTMEDKTDSTTAAVTVSYMSDATTGGTADFYFRTPTAPTDPTSFSGPYNGTFASRLKVEIYNADCANFGTTTVAAELTVGSYPSIGAYRVVTTLAAMGLQDHTCYQIQPFLDGAPLGSRDVKVESTPNQTPPGVLRWNGPANVIIGFSLRNVMDTDGDGVLNHVDQCPTDAGSPSNNGCPIVDNCPSDPNKTDPGFCGCGFTDVDADSDGFYDSTGGGSGAQCDDQCDSDPLKIAPGQCGCGTADTDTDGDGTADCNDACPADPNKTSAGACGCGVSDTGDTDGDGTPDCTDSCPTDPRFQTTTGVCGCNAYSIDYDEDGVPDTCSTGNSCVLAPT